MKKSHLLFRKSNSKFQVQSGCSAREHCTYEYRYLSQETNRRRIASTIFSQSDQRQGSGEIKRRSLVAEPRRRSILVPRADNTGPPGSFRLLPTLQRLQQRSTVDIGFSPFSVAPSRYIVGDEESPNSTTVDEEDPAEADENDNVDAITATSNNDRERQNFQEYKNFISRSLHLVLLIL